MRAGGFAEERVIELINRRFVPYYYEVSGQGCAANPEAAEFVGKKTRNPWAFLAAFAPDGELLGETALYADKDQVFEFLHSLLVRHPEFAESAADERALLSALRGPELDSVTGLAAGELLVGLASILLRGARSGCVRRQAGSQGRARGCDRDGTAGPLRPRLGRRAMRGRWPSNSSHNQLSTTAIALHSSAATTRSPMASTRCATVLEARSSPATIALAVGDSVLFGCRLLLCGGTRSLQVPLGLGL